MLNARRLFKILILFILTLVFCSGCSYGSSGYGSTSTIYSGPYGYTSSYHNYGISNYSFCYYCSYHGSTMAWVDGSVLGFVPQPTTQDNNGQKGFWITLNPISNYQLSLCVQAGKCNAPTDPDYLDPSSGNLPVGIVGPDMPATTSTNYCAWIKGRLPTDSEKAFFGDGSVHDVTNELHCVVDHPLPMPQFVGTSPYYDPGVPMEDMTPKVLKTVQFCQNGQGFETIDLELDEDASLQSVSGLDGSTCEIVNDNRVVCYGAPNSNPQAKAGLLCNGFNGMRCQIGSEFDGAGCSNNMRGGPLAGMDDWELNANGVLVPIHGVQPPGTGQDTIEYVREFPNGALVGPVLQNAVIINGVMVARSLPGNSIPSNGVSSNGVSSNEVSSNGTFEGNICPVGYYFDSALQGCASLGAPLTECLDGYHFNGEKFGCEADQPNGNYPGCSMGQLLNPLTGACDTNSKMASLTGLAMTVGLQVNLPQCSESGSTDSGANGCPAGYTYTCDPVCGCAPP
jgi:hypothetical protein